MSKELSKIAKDFVMVADSKSDRDPKLKDMKFKNLGYEYITSMIDSMVSLLKIEEGFGRDSQEYQKEFIIMSDKVAEMYTNQLGFDFANSCIPTQSKSTEISKGFENLGAKNLAKLTK